MSIHFLQAHPAMSPAWVRCARDGLLPTGQVRSIHRNTPAEQVDALLRERLGQELQVHVLRLDPDAGHVFVSERTPAGRQLSLRLFGATGGS